MMSPPGLHANIITLHSIEVFVHAAPCPNEEVDGFFG